MSQQQINELVQSFTRELNALVRASTLKAAAAALTPASARNNGARATVSSVTKATAGKAKSAPGIEVRLVEQLRASPNLRTEQIGVALGLPTSRIKPLLAKLVASGVLTKAGERRGTRYAIAR
jgi:hypothetical protein